MDIRVTIGLPNSAALPQLRAERGGVRRSRLQPDELHPVLPGYRPG
jgi:hypothetical protein